MEGKRIRGNLLYFGDEQIEDPQMQLHPLEEKTRLVIEEDTIYEIDLNCERCKNCKKK